MEKIKYAYVVTGEYPLFIMAKCLNHQDSMGLIETLRNLPGVEETNAKLKKFFGLNQSVLAYAGIQSEQYLMGSSFDFS